MVLVRELCRQELYQVFDIAKYNEGMLAWNGEKDRVFYGYTIKIQPTV